MYDLRLEMASADVSVGNFMNTDELALKDKNGKITFEMGRNETVDIAAGIIQSFNQAQIEALAESLVSRLPFGKLSEFINIIISSKKERFL